MNHMLLLVAILAAVITVPVLAAGFTRVFPLGGIDVCNIAGDYDSGVITRSAEAALTTARLLVKKGTGDNQVNICGLADTPIGTNQDTALIDGSVAVELLGNKPGPLIVIASKAIAVGVDVYNAAGGKVSDVAGTGASYIGISLTAGTTDAEMLIAHRTAVTVPTAIADSSVTAAKLAASLDLSSKTLTLPTAQPIVPALTMQTVLKTAGATLTTGFSGGVISNAGASGTVTMVLPAATVGLNYTFLVEAVQELRIDPNTTQTIALPSTGVQGGAGKYIVADAVGEYVRLVCLTAGTWSVLGYSGTWTAEG